MLLLLLRHGIAHDREAPDCPPDPDRELTAKGRRRTRAAVRGLRRLDLHPRAVISSPWARAVQTARIAAEAFDLDPEGVRRSESLLPDHDPEELFGLLRRSPEEDILACGHAPLLDEILAAALGTPRPIGRLGKAGAACLEWAQPTAGSARLRWLLEPSALRRLGKA